MSRFRSEAWASSSIMGGVGVGQAQYRESRTGHEARVSRADRGSRQVVVAMVVVVYDSPTEGIVSCARVVVGAVGTFCGEPPFEGFAHRFGQEWPGLVLWTECFEGCWLLLVVLCPLACVLVG